MKKISKKILALLLAMVMVFGVVPNIFPAAEEVKASETTDIVDEFAGYDVEYNFVNADLSTMPELKSTQLLYANSVYTIIDGQSERPLSDHWFTGTSGYSTSTTNKNNGLKTKNSNNTTENGNKHSMITLMEDCENFEMQLEMNAGSNFGVAIGSKNVFPTGNNDGVRVYFANARLQVSGKYNSYSTAGTQEHYISASGSNKNLLLFNPKANSSNGLYSLGLPELTLNVSIYNGVLKVWVTGYDATLTVELADGYDRNVVSLIGNIYNGGGGFNSVKLSKYDSAYHFEGADLSKLPLTSTQLSNASPYGVLEGQENKALSDHWFIGTSGYTTTTNIKNNGLKPKNNNSDANLKYSFIPVISGVKDFEMSLDMYASSDFGIAIGSKNVMPGAGTNTGAKIYFAGGYMRLVGTFDASSLKVTGTSYSWGWNTSGKDLNFNPKSTTTGTNIYTNRQLETLNIKVQGNLLTLSMDSCDTVLSIRLTDTSSMNTVSLYGRYYNGGGGFKSVGLRRSKTQYDFEKADLSLIDLKSTQLNNSSPYNVLEGQEDKSLADHWFTGTSGYTTSTNIKNNALKPKNNNSEANLKYSMIPIMSGAEDFELNLDIYASSDFGVTIGSKNVMPGAGTNTGAKIYFAGGYMRLVGTFDASSLNVTGTEYSYGWNGTPGTDLNFNPKSTTTGTNIYTNRQLETLNIRVQENVLTLWLDSSDTVLTIGLTDTSAMDTVSLFGRYYNCGG